MAASGEWCPGGQVRWYFELLLPSDNAYYILCNTFLPQKMTVVQPFMKFIQIDAFVLKIPECLLTKHQQNGIIILLNCRKRFPSSANTEYNYRERQGLRDCQQEGDYEKQNIPFHFIYCSSMHDGSIIDCSRIGCPHQPDNRLVV